MTSSRPLLVLLWFIHVTIPVLEAQEVKVEPEVTGYLGEEVTLRCQFIPGPKDDIISQVEWELETPAGDKIFIIVSRGESRGRTPAAFSFPSGAFEGTTTLVVKGEYGPVPSD
ncbi:hypothetical protein KUCAC02_014390 [Chaenocephalus aceratus]|uniref:Uncharacterized protein n=1 Tax=Chaenocephalus aceratus TaxID=36190 RepID=A0ACB9WF59_CHAAC|nr:hypothetical protein KUCAC02_014390 [Chaenocephalus aceratus]